MPLPWLADQHPAVTQTANTVPQPPNAPIAGAGPDVLLSQRFNAAAKAGLLQGAVRQRLKAANRNNIDYADRPSPQHWATHPDIEELVGTGNAVNNPAQGYTWRPVVSPTTSDGQPGPGSIGGLL